MNGPIATRTQRIAAGITAVVAVLVVLPRLAPGPGGIHDLPQLSSTITVCDRQYHRDDRVRSLADVAADGVSPVLVDPGLLGLFPSCPGSNPDGNRPCTRDASEGACATVVHVRIGADAYVAYELSGGP